MDFRYTDEQEMMAGVVRDLLAEHCRPADLRRLMTSGAARDEGRWQKLVELGLLGALVPEAAGGLGLAEIDFLPIAEACGAAALPEPLVEQAGIVLPLLAELAPSDPSLARALAGEITVALNHPANPFIADADTAGALLAIAQDQAHLARDLKDLHFTRQPSTDPFRRLFTAALPGGAAVGEELTQKSVVAADINAASARAFNRGALFAAAQLLGMAQSCIELARDYACTRQQFGKPIGTNQAVKHLLANAQVKVEFARPVVQAAAALAPQGDLAAEARISQAKLAASEAADLAARTAIQVHGAMGYSWEVDVHFYLKRALALTSSWGTPAFHRARVARRVFAAPLGPEFTFASSAELAAGESQGA